jgi:hypothetical protein
MVTLLLTHWIWFVFAFACFGVGLFGYLLLAKPEDVALGALGRISGAELSLDTRTVFTPTNRAGRLYAPTVNRIMVGIRRFLPGVTSDYLAPRLLVAGIDSEPEVWLGEIIFATGFIFLIALIATRLFSNPNGIHIPPWVILLALIVPIFRWTDMTLKMRSARSGVRETLPQLFTIAATVARITTSIEGPNGLLSYMVNLVDSPAAEVLRKILIRAASTNRSVEEIMDEFSIYYRVPALQGLAANIRLARRKGGAGLPQAIANASIRLAEQEIDRMVSNAAIKSQFSMMAVVIFNMPGLMIMLMAPAVARFATGFSGGG